MTGFLLLNNPVANEIFLQRGLWLFILARLY